MKKKILTILFGGILLLAITGCVANDEQKIENNPEKVNSNSKSLVLYFSVTGTTKEIAKKISDATKSDIIEIIPKDKYTSKDVDYNDDNSRANKEMSNIKARPEIENEINIDEYETIYIGYPIWWGTSPRIILTLLDTVDLENKNVALFCTSGSSSIDKSIKDLKEYNSKINFIGGRRFESNAEKSEIENWVNSLK